MRVLTTRHRGRREIQIFHLRVISARDMNKKEKKYYEENGQTNSEV